MTIKFFVLAAVCCLVSQVNAQNAMITWQAPQNLSDGVDFTDESFISNNGSLVSALNPGGAAGDITANGITFVAMPSNGVTTADQNLTSADGVFAFTLHNINDVAFQAGNSNANSMEFEGTAVGDLIRGGLWSVDTITINNLTPGNDYEIQILGNDARSSRSTAFLCGYGDGVNLGTAAVIMELNNSPDNTATTTAPATEVGDFVIGTFTANAPTQTFEVFGTNSGDVANLGLGDSRAHVNAIQLRDVTSLTPVDCVLADVDQNGIVDFNDIPDFVDVLLMGPFQCEADCDENGLVDFNDIPFFVDILLNP